MEEESRDARSINNEERQSSRPPCVCQLFICHTAGTTTDSIEKARQLSFGGSNLPGLKASGEVKGAVPRVEEAKQGSRGWLGPHRLPAPWQELPCRATPSDLDRLSRTRPGIPGIQPGPTWICSPTLNAETTQKCLCNCYFKSIRIFCHIFLRIPFLS